MLVNLFEMALLCSVHDQVEHFLRTQKLQRIETAADCSQEVRLSRDKSVAVYVRCCVVQDRSKHHRIMPIQLLIQVRL